MREKGNAFALARVREVVGNEDFGFSCLQNVRRTLQTGLEPDDPRQSPTTASGSVRRPPSQDTRWNAQLGRFETVAEYSMLGRSSRCITSRPVQIKRAEFILQSFIQENSPFTKLSSSLGREHDSQSIRDILGRQRFLIR